MDKLLFCLSVLITLTEAFVQTNLDGKVFVFPRESYTDYVDLIPQSEKPLQNFTLCFRAYSDLSRPYTLFSYNTQGGNNELLVYKEGAQLFGLYIGNVRATFKVLEDFSVPVHYCAKWESSTGIAEFWVNGKPSVRKGVQQGYSVKPHPKIVLGQEQDNYGGGFEITESFMGEFGDLYMWDSLLCAEEILAVYQGSVFNPNILDWKALNYEMKGYVVIKPQLWN
ncbi:PREDICTED: serum amyloid P-component [Elephantulus edwardii]|uniref:serum amyloid P-component n=1 Tax=Elephantulus edwardii TaxID=28737 RepID=UPI0003F0DF7B|nr:PREDICTED: serum amyloid P-component [Elephantulus edwardii]